MVAYFFLLASQCFRAKAIRRRSNRGRRSGLVTPLESRWKPRLTSCLSPVNSSEETDVTRLSIVLLDDRTMSKSKPNLPIGTLVRAV